MLQLKPERLDVGEFDEQPLSICGKSFVAHVSGGLYWPAEEALIVADLHLEKGSAFAGRGSLLPPYDTAETLSRLAAAIDHFQARTVIALGDSFHDAEGPQRLAASDRETLGILQDGVEWIWMTGNHDPELPASIGGHVVDTLDVGGLNLRHHPREGRATHEIAGHLHPAARLSLHGFHIRRPCFISNGLRVVLPAFGTYAGGLNVMDDAFLPLFGNDGFSVWMLGQEGLYPVATRLLQADDR
jgi:uncharacterized protein